ncbi:MAG: heavy-metal-associated domain-containing protein [Burkholderiales bacterium]|nr:heavy-metal-associated domain-containing protein [Burkholderiales bacterium]
METTTLNVGGMTCGGCVGSVTRVLQSSPGVTAAEVSLDRGEAKITFDPAVTSPAALRKAIEAAGFTAG